MKGKRRRFPFVSFHIIRCLIRFSVHEKPEIWIEIQLKKCIAPAYSKRVQLAFTGPDDTKKRKFQTGTFFAEEEGFDPPDPCHSER